jgi:hypothetical protein
MNSVRNAFQWLLGPSEADPLVRLLGAWRFWVAAAILGILLGWLAYTISPPPYRARATIVVDFNLEDMLPGYEPRKTFHLLSRETRKVEEIAWADDTLATVAAEFGNVSVTELRSGKLILSQPSDGGWHFWGEDVHSSRAQELAALWAETFIQNLREAVELSGEVEDAREALAEAVYSTDEPDLELIEILTQELSIKAGLARGVTPYVGVNLTQAADLPLQRAIHLSIYLFVGAGLLAILSSLSLLFFSRETLSENAHG